MHIAFLHNLQTETTPEQAEFDTPATVRSVIALLEELGHTVSPVDAAYSIPFLVTRLDMLKPDLVLNTAEGIRGRGREGFYPGLLDQLGLPYTGSDAYVCTVTLDKKLTSLTLSASGVPVPRSRLVGRTSDLDRFDLSFPVIAKPNYEGSSKGISAESVAEDLDSLRGTVEILLREYPNGILVEEFIVGRDVTVPYIESLGVLEPAHYEFAGPPAKYPIYDFDLKQNRPNDVVVICPACIGKETRKKLRAATRKAVEVLGVRDLCRVDFRVTEDGRIFLIEVNALPSLEPGAAIYLCARESGVESDALVLAAILKSATKRHGVKPGKVKKRSPERVGLVYNLKRGYVSTDRDEQAEFDSESTVSALAQAIHDNGFEVVRLEATPELPSRLGEVDLVFNIAEGVKGRYRESQIPALLELMGVEFTGSEAGSLAVCHDKGLAKKIVRQAGVPTADFRVVGSAKEARKLGLRFPLMVKPVAEGSSKGVAVRSVVRDESTLQEVVRDITERYRQPALVEEFLSGREFTVGLLGQQKLKMLPIMEIVFQEDIDLPIYSFEHKLTDAPPLRFEVPASLHPALRREIEGAAKACFRALGCRDVARIDFRMDSSGVVNFIECNPLPGLTPDFSDLCVLAKAADLNYQELVGQILTPAVKRFRLRRKPGISISP